MISSHFHKIISENESGVHEIRADITVPAPKSTRSLGGYSIISALKRSIIQFGFLNPNFKNHDL